MKLILKNSDLRFDFYQRSWRDIDFSQLSVISKVINAQGSWEAGIGFSYLIPRESGDTKVKIKSNASNANAYTFVKSDNTSGTAQFCDGITERTILQANTEVEINIPSDCTHLYITCGVSAAGDRMPQYYKIYG